MRACSAWPSGVWIDGDKRTAPDGSSFAWQHWSHTFEYALAAGPGDWRDAGFAVAGQDYNHDLLACETGLHPGPHPAAASLASAELPVMVSALKPRGNPLAAGRAGRPRRADEVTARLRDLGSRAPAAARLSLFTGITAAEGLSLVEDGPGVADGAGPGTGAGATALPVRAARPRSRSRPAGTVTLGLSVPAKVAGPGARPRTRLRRLPRNPRSPSTPATGCTARGPPRPGTCRWRCTCPHAGSHSPGRAAPRTRRRCASPWPAGPSQPRAPWNSTSRPGWRPRRAARSATTCRRWATRTGTWRSAARRARPPGHYFLAARIRDQLGQVLEDVTAVMLGGSPLPDLGLPLDALLPALRADEQAIAAEVQVTVLTPEIRVRPGGAGELAGAGGQPGRLPGPRRGAADFAVRQLAGVASLDARFLRLPRKRGNSPLSCRGTDYYPARHAVVDNGQTDVFRSTSLHQQRSRTHLRMKESTPQGAGPPPSTRRSSMP